MRHRYYHDGGPLEDTTIHRNKHCSELSDPIRPLADSTVESIDADFCPECTDAEPESESEPVSEESETGAGCDKCGQSHDDGACWDLIENGECPWCGSEYESVGRHASSAHPEEWNRYKDES